MKRLLYIAALAFLPLFLSAQTKEQPKPNWQNLDLKEDSVFGISTEKAYHKLLKGKTAKPVIVAVIDGGVDNNHEDLKQVMWVNEKEIAGNGKDDDNNGYIDDINGWNFIGSAKGNVRYDNLELARLIRKFQPKYASALNSTPFDEKGRKEFILYQKMVTEYMDKLQNAQMGLENTTMFKKYLDEISTKIGKEYPTLEDFESYKSANDIESKVIKAVKAELKDGDYKKFRKDIEEGLKYYNTQVTYNLNLEFDSRDTVNDNYSTDNERYYGNADVTGPDALHGTHVSGIVGANRINNLGIKGVSDYVRIMAIRAVPDGDERDKDVANAIRYAADNGAKVINMSFGKSYSWDKKVVDEAVKYALLKDVLLVHAAGNDSKNTEKEENFPNRLLADSLGITMGTADAWIEVGASSWKDDEDLVADFSNYGKKSVDVFAPGVKINSTVPDSTKYKEEDGTSMASPVVAGLAALIRSYYPKFTAFQVKEIIMNSVSKVDHKVKIKEDGSSRKVPFSEVCLSGGIVNAYNALILAEKTSHSSVNIKKAN